MARYRRACFTLNNYSDDEYKHLLEGQWKYLVMGKEVGEKGTPHLQGYVEMEQVRFNKLKKMLGERCHIEMCAGSPEQNEVYCKKAGDWIEVGVRSKPGERTDLTGVRLVAREAGMRGVTNMESVNSQAIRVAEKWLTYNEDERDWVPEVVWIYGESGCGKSKFVRELAGEDYYTKNSGSMWYEGYDAHEVVIFDDFRESWWPIEEMLGLLDRYGKRVEFKGGSRQFLAKRIYITTVRSPRLHYQGGGEPIEQLMRRRL